MGKKTFKFRIKTKYIKLQKKIQMQECFNDSVSLIHPSLLFCYPV